MRLELGKQVRCTDEVVGELADVVIDPIERRITHLVVKPHHGHGEARLVPIEVAARGGDEESISLRCTADDVRRLPNVEKLAYVRLGEDAVSDPNWDVGVRDVLAMPYYESAGVGDYVGALQGVEVVYDQVPKDEVELRRSSSVFTAGGEYVGSVDGFVVDDDRITHVVIECGHLWNRREVTVPIGAVGKVESDSVFLGLSKDEVAALPAHRFHRWPWKPREEG
jgi:sporulation protein YlmC with PRC-barrel domain